MGCKSLFNDLRGTSFVIGGSMAGLLINDIGRELKV